MPKGIWATRDRMSTEEQIRKRFWAKVNKTDTCWNWQGSKTTAGYGQLTIRKKVSMATRVSYEWAHNVKLTDPKVLVCHSCDNPACVRPEHLFLGSHKDNHQDSIKKNRHAFGENHGNCTISDNAVREIRKLRGKIHNAKIASNFGISVSAVVQILAGTRRKYVK